MIAAARPRLPALETPRLVLRGLRAEDVAAVAALAGDRRVSRWLLTFPYPAEVAAAWIAEAQARWRSGRGATFAITRRGELIGAIGVRVSARHGHAELGFWLGAPAWGQGYAAEAGRAIVPWAFRRWRLRRIWAQYMGDNHASGRVLEKIGLAREGVRRRHLRKGRRWYDAHQYGLLREDVRWP